MATVGTNPCHTPIRRKCAQEAKVREPRSNCTSSFMPLYVQRTAIEARTPGFCVKRDSCRMVRPLTSLTYIVIITLFFFLTFIVSAYPQREKDAMSNLVPYYSTHSTTHLYSTVVRDEREWFWNPSPVFYYFSASKIPGVLFVLLIFLTDTLMMQFTSNKPPFQRLNGKVSFYASIESTSTLTEKNSKPERKGNPPCHFNHTPQSSLLLKQIRYSWFIPLIRQVSQQHR